MTGWCFIHIPKNAGSSIRRAVGKDGYHGDKYVRRHPSGNRLSVPAHICASWIRDGIGQGAWDSLDSFAVVRNPWDRMVSLYQYLKPAAEWETWMRKALQHDKPSGNQHRLQLYYIADEDGTVMVKHLLRFETLADDFGRLCSALSWPKKQLPKMNATKPHRRAAWYSSSMQQRVAEHFAKDIEAFNYTFQGD
jgi:hypothetical protein